MQSEYRNASVWLTGHSLGGALSSLLGVTFGLPAVAFESPGERMAAQRLHLPRPPALPYEKMNIWHVGHSADPIFMGVCNVIIINNFDYVFFFFVFHSPIILNVFFLLGYSKFLLYRGIRCRHLKIETFFFII